MLNHVNHLHNLATTGVSFFDEVSDIQLDIYYEFIVCEEPYDLSREEKVLKIRRVLLFAYFEDILLYM